MWKARTYSAGGEKMSYCGGLDGHFRCAAAISHCWVFVNVAIEMKANKERHVCNSEACLTCLRFKPISWWHERHGIQNRATDIKWLVMWISGAQSLTHMNEVLYRCFHGLQWWSCPRPHHWEDLSQCLSQNIENEWPYFQCLEFHVILQHCAMYFQMPFHSTRFEICTDFGQLTHYGAPPFQHFIVQDRRGWLGSKICFTVWWGGNDF